MNSSSYPATLQPLETLYLEADFLITVRESISAATNLRIKSSNPTTGFHPNRCRTLAAFPQLRLMSEGRHREESGFTCFFQSSPN
jgi:hypothetical protein